LPTFNHAPIIKISETTVKYDLPLLRDSSQEVRDIPDKHHLNRSQIRALAKLKATPDEAFQEITRNTRESEFHGNLCGRGLIIVLDMATEIDRITDRNEQV